MVLSKCSSCQNTIFEVVHNEPQTSQYILLFVQCAQCGTVVGTMDYDNIGVRLNKQDAAIKIIAAALKVHVNL